MSETTYRITMSDTIPRLSEAEMDPALAEMLGPRVERLGYLGEFFRCAAHQPRALMSFMNFTQDLKKALPDDLTEVVALSVAALMNNSYERVQHERLCLKLGFSESWIREILSLQPNAGGLLTRQELVVQKLVIAIISRSGRDTSDELNQVVESIGYSEATAVLLLIGRYVTHSLFVNCLNLAPPVAPL